MMQRVTRRIDPLPIPSLPRFDQRDNQRAIIAATEHEKHRRHMASNREDEGIWKPWLIK